MIPLRLNLPKKFKESRLARILYWPYKWLVFMPALTAFTILCGACAILLASTAGPKRANVMGVIWARIMAGLTPMRVTVEGAENIQKGRSYVICSNHASHFDIFVLYGWFPALFKWVMKIELRKVPFLGMACDRLGHIYIDRSDSARAIASINAARERITDGASVLFFPEGTRSRDGNLRPFKKGAFKLALDMDLPILPVTITGTAEILPSHTLNLFPGAARLIIHPPIETSGYGDSRIGELMAAVRAAVESGFDGRND
jgi:1-acyl-sn-glycerol-3-phosphate acyltransferase